MAVNETLVARLVVNQRKPHTRLAARTQDLLPRYGIPVLATQIGDREAFRHAAAAGLTVADLPRARPAAAEIEAFTAKQGDPFISPPTLAGMVAMRLLLALLVSLAAVVPVSARAQDPETAPPSSLAVTCSLQLPLGRLPRMWTSVSGWVDTDATWWMTAGS